MTRTIVGRNGCIARCDRKRARDFDVGAQLRIDADEPKPEFAIDRAAR